MCLHKDNQGKNQVEDRVSSRDELPEPDLRATRTTV